MSLSVTTQTPRTSGNEREFRKARIKAAQHMGFHIFNQAPWYRCPCFYQRYETNNKVLRAKLVEMLDVF
jgi:hypothetical protein